MALLVIEKVKSIFKKYYGPIGIWDGTFRGTWNIQICERAFDMGPSNGLIKWPNNVNRKLHILLKKLRMFSHISLVNTRRFFHYFFIVYVRIDLIYLPRRRHALNWRNNSSNLLYFPNFVASSNFTSYLATLIYTLLTYLLNDI